MKTARKLLIDITFAVFVIGVVALIAFLYAWFMHERQGWVSDGHYRDFPYMQMWVSIGAFSLGIVLSILNTLITIGERLKRD